MTIVPSADMIGQFIKHPALKGRLMTKTYKKGAHLFHAGDVFPHVVFMTRGLVKFSYTTHDGKEWIKSFVDGRGVFASLSSQLIDAPSTFSACCLERTDVLLCRSADLENAYKNDPQLAHALLKMHQMVGLKKELREHAFLCRSAEQRYADFMLENKDLADRITQVDMARYLGITPIALSRIKKRLSTPNNQPAAKY